MKERGKPFLGIIFRCCQTYGRIYKNADGTAYEGYCPRCRLKIRVPIGVGGTKRRFFIAYPR